MENIDCISRAFHGVCFGRNLINSWGMH